MVDCLHSGIGLDWNVEGVIGCWHVLIWLSIKFMYFLVKTFSLTYSKETHYIITRKNKNQPWWIFGQNKWPKSAKIFTARNHSVNRHPTSSIYNHYIYISVGTWAGTYTVSFLTPEGLRTSFPLRICEKFCLKFLVLPLDTISQDFSKKPGFCWS